MLYRCFSLGNSPHFHPRARQRYQTHFGPLNQRVVVGNHTFVLLDAPGLVEEDYLRASDGSKFEHWSAPSKGTVDFIKTFATGKNTAASFPPGVLLLTMLGSGVGGSSDFV